jgi:lipopolysaccharide heptosyltransferase II
MKNLLAVAMSMQSAILRFWGGLRGYAPRLPGAAATGDVQSILVVRIDEIGDTVLASVWLRNLRRAYPKAHITLVVKAETLGLLQQCPYVDELVTLTFPRGRAMRWFMLPWVMVSFARKRLASAKFDLAILPRWDVDAHYATFLTYASGAARRIGFSEHVNERKCVLNRGFDALLTRAVDERKAVHEVEHGFALLEALGTQPDDAGLELWYDGADRSAAAELLRRLGIGESERILAIAPGAGRPRRQWPKERFAEAAKQVSEKHGLRVVVVGGPADRPAGDWLAGEIGPRAVSAAGETTLRQTAALLSRCACFIGNDSGPLHIAAAAGVPVVEISSHPLDGDPADVESPRRFGPWKSRAAVIQPDRALAPCRKRCTAGSAHCITRVGVSDVVTAADGLLARG